jgi:hypothetical protein
MAWSRGGNNASGAYGGGGTDNPYEFFGNVMRNGYYSPQQQQDMASSAASRYGTAMLGERGQMVDRAAASGNLSPWMTGGSQWGSTLGSVMAGNRAEMDVDLSNQQARMGAATQRAGIDQFLAQLDMAATQNDETPDFYQRLLDLFYGLVGQTTS